jgi:pimeloyl-ACP methyl ester carboxylesterase
MLDDPDGVLEAFVEQLAPPDREVLGHAGGWAVARDDATEGVRPGIEGFFEEHTAGYVLDWGFRLADVDVPVDVFHGTEDTWIPVGVGELLTERLPQGRLRALGGRGHVPPWEVHAALLRAAIGRDRRVHQASSRES